MKRYIRKLVYYFENHQLFLRMIYHCYHRRVYNPYNRQSFLVPNNWAKNRLKNNISNIISDCHLTPSEKYRIPTPIGMNAIPITKKVGNTVPAVKIGCHAGNFCCLKALSVNTNLCEQRNEHYYSFDNLI